MNIRIPAHSVTVHWQLVNNDAINIDVSLSFLFTFVYFVHWVPSIVASGPLVCLSQVKILFHKPNKSKAYLQQITGIIIKVYYNMFI